jgi:hypothetical protein
MSYLARLLWKWRFHCPYITFFQCWLWFFDGFTPLFCYIGQVEKVIVRQKTLSMLKSYVKLKQFLRRFCCLSWIFHLCKTSCHFSCLLWSSLSSVYLWVHILFHFIYPWLFLLFVLLNEFRLDEILVIYGYKVSQVLWCKTIISRVYGLHWSIKLLFFYFNYFPT